jgi:hypothetical protein
LDKLLQHIKEEQQNSLVNHSRHAGIFWAMHEAPTDWLTD